MPKKKYIVDLTPEEREALETLLSSGKDSARKLTRARILLKADEDWTGAAGGGCDGGGGGGARVDAVWSGKRRRAGGTGLHG
jgi:hypothetical protein